MREMQEIACRMDENDVAPEDRWVFVRMPKRHGLGVNFWIGAVLAIVMVAMAVTWVLKIGAAE